jgi:hypothetical protein
MFSNKIQQISSAKFFCEICDYHTSRKCNYDEHLLTSKHKSAMFSNEKPAISSAKFMCPNCCKFYKDNSGLWRHKKKCLVEDIDNIMPTNQSQNQTYDQPNKDNLIEYLIKENAEFKTLIMELVKKDNNNLTNINSHNVNSNNKTFNLQFFLNEQCKDALNIGEFVDSIKVQLTDLETVGRIGYVEGVSKILIKNLNELDVIKRPIHCSDLKREVLYIKDDDKWSKENDDKLVIKKAIKDVANKNIKQIPVWTNLNPDCKNADSKSNDQYLKIVMNSMSGGSNEEQNHNIEKIIKNITKSVIIEK